MEVEVFIFIIIFILACTWYYCNVTKENYIMYAKTTYDVLIILIPFVGYIVFNAIKKIREIEGKNDNK